MRALEDIKDILRGALAKLGGFGGRIIARLILMVMAGQLYGALSIGLLGQIAAITEILAAIAVLGLKRTLLDLLSHKNATDKAPKIIKEALVSALSLSVLMTAALAILWPYLFPDIPMPTLLYFAIPSVVFAEVAGAAIRFKRIIKWEIIARCVFEPWAFVFTAAFFYWFNPSVTSLLTAYAASSVAAAIGIAIGVKKAYGFKTILSAKIDIQALYQIPKKSFPVGITDVGVMMFRRIDILVLSLVAGHQVTGIYYMAQQIVTVPHKIHQLFDPMMTPVLAKLHHGGKKRVISEKLSGFCRWVFSLQLALTVPFIVFSSEMMGLFGPQFALGGVVLSLLLLAELLDGSFALGETALVYAKPKIPPQLIFGALVIEIVAIYILALHWGAEGAAAGFLIAMASLTIGRLFSLKKFLGIQILNKAFFSPLSFAVLIGLSLFSLKTLFDIHEGIIFGPTIAISIALFLGLMKTLGMTTGDKSILKRLRAG